MNVLSYKGLGMEIEKKKEKRKVRDNCLLLMVGGGEI
jgi:hypothetical protein